MIDSGFSVIDERELGIERSRFGVQWSLGWLFSITAMVALDLVAIIAPSAGVVTSTIVGSSILLALLLRIRLGNDKGRTALIAFGVSLIHCAGLAACQSIYLLTFFPDPAVHSIGLGYPLSAAIMGAVLGIPLALISSLCSFLIAYAVVPRQAGIHRRPGFSNSRNR